MKKQYPYQEVYERFGFKCAYCGIDGSNDFETWFTANFSVDHINPRKHGGTGEPDNLALACHSCNLYKGSTECHSVEEAKEIIRQKKRQARNWYEKYILSKDTAAHVLPGTTPST